MLAFPAMLVTAAENAGITVPDDPENYDSDAFPHFSVFCLSQLCRPVVYHGEHWDNAKVIAAIPETEIRQVTLVDLLDRGLSFAQ